MQIRHFYIASAALFLLLSLTGAGPYRCNGMVRQHPCRQAGPEASLKQARSSALKAARNMQDKAVPGRTKARLEKLAFRKVNERTGLWTGYVRGQSPIRLTLELIAENGKVEARNIGEVRTASDRQAIAFSYQTSLPREARWHWRIVPGL